LPEHVLIIEIISRGGADHFWNLQSMQDQVGVAVQRPTFRAGLVNGHDVELWQSDRMLGAFKHKDK
jgi:hypothetical protein